MVNLKTNILVSFFILFLGVSVYSQVTVEWDYNIGEDNIDESIVDIKSTDDNHYIILGEKQSPVNNSTDIWLVKISEEGDTVWTKTYGGTEDEHSVEVQPLSDGDYLILGNTQSYGPGWQSAWLMKVDSSGDTLWTELFDLGPQPIDEGDEGISLKPTHDDNFVLFGVEGQTDSPYIIKFTSSGYTIWSKMYTDLTSFSEPDFGNINNALSLSDSNFLLMDENYLFKVSSTGDSLWLKQIRGVSGIKKIQETSDGGIIMVGMTEESWNSPSNALMYKVNVDGDSLWSETFGGDAADYAVDVVETDSSNLLLVGTTESFDSNGRGDGWLIKTDMNGNFKWSQTFGETESEQFTTIQSGLNGGYILGGIAIVSPASMNDGWLVKISTNATGLSPKNDILPNTVQLYQNHPNPFNPVTTISYSLYKKSSIKLFIYDLRGRLISTLVDQNQGQGYYQYSWNASKFASGIYYYQLVVDNFSFTKKMVHIK